MYFQKYNSLFCFNQLQACVECDSTSIFSHFAVKSTYLETPQMSDLIKVKFCFKKFAVQRVQIGVND